MAPPAADEVLLDFLIQDPQGRLNGAVSVVQIFLKELSMSLSCASDVWRVLHIESSAIDAHLKIHIVALPFESYSHTSV
jgi:hypothetical protein